MIRFWWMGGSEFPVFNRPNYYVVLPFLKLEERADTLGLFSIKQDTSLKHLAKEYISIYEYLPGF